MTHIVTRDQTMTTRAEPHTHGAGPSFTITVDVADGASQLGDRADRSVAE